MDAGAFTAADDALHDPGEKYSWTETFWWSFNVPERALGGWLYVQIRPHQNSTAGGAFVWDATASLPWELPYFAWFQHQRLPSDLDLRDAVLPSGVTMTQVVPGQTYDLGYRFRDETDFVAQLRFDGITAPFPYATGKPPFSASSHFDQPGRVSGRITLRGEEIAVDCLSVRDRSWGPRPEHWGRNGRLSYAFGTADEANGFLAFCAPASNDPFTDEETVVTGYLLHDGEIGRLRSGRRSSRRAQADGIVREIDLRLEDDLGRGETVAGESLSRMVLPRHRITYNSLLRWKWEDRTGFGEDQDLWPVALTADRIRAKR